MLQDSFAQDRLPAPQYQPDFLLDQPDFQLPDQLNCVTELLDRHLAAGHAQQPVLHTLTHTWTYGELAEKVNRIANVLINDLGMVSGNRVLLRAANNPMFVACWLAVAKAGGVVVATMPLLREKELSVIVEKAETRFALCDARLADELQAVQSAFLEKIVLFDGLCQQTHELEQRMAVQSAQFAPHPTQATDVVLIAFTSGTTGNPKMTAHYHRDILLICKGYPVTSLQPHPTDIFTGSPPIAFTFGLGGLVLFPMYYGASAVLLENPSPDNLLRAIAERKVTICFTAPTAWRVLTTKVTEYDLTSLRKCVSAGETLPLVVWQDWYNHTGLKLLDGIGATEMLHIFISADDNSVRPGATGRPVHGYEAKVIDPEGNTCPPNQPGRLAVRGITGCRYLADSRQRHYVQDGWNITGDIFRQDEDGYFWFVSRNDDMIVSAGYNIAGPEVESVLLAHPDIEQCAVIGAPDPERGMIVCAFVVLKDPTKASDQLATDMQDWFKQQAAPYKYPRRILFIDTLPKSAANKITRYKLKELL